MLNRWGEHYSERGKKASSKYGRLRAKELKREAEFRLEDKDGLMYVVPRHGEVVGGVCGLTVWGRTCTGQAIALDYLWQQKAAEMWPEELENLEELK